MISDKDVVGRLAPLARAWATAQEAFILKVGAPLGAMQIADAERAGVKDTARIRVIPVDRIPMPEELELAEAARRAQIITENSAAVTVGHGIMIRADRWRDRELMVHQLVHVAQCERCGGLDSFVEQYLIDRSTCPEFTVGALEDEARNVARELCAAEAT